MQRPASKKTPIAFGIALLVVGCLILLLGGVYFAAGRLRAVLPGLAAGASAGSSKPETTLPAAVRTPLGAAVSDTLTALEQMPVPINDYTDLACRLKEICNVAATLQPPASPRQVGEQDQFWVTNQDSLNTFQVTATLRYVTPHIYFWVENGVSYNEPDLRNLADTFETKTYPTDRTFFGSEWTPGIDGDVHIYILYVHGLGSNVAGLFSADDENNPAVRKYSNGHEMFEINSTQNLGSDFTYGTLAHEFQHMIEWHLHRNQSTWMSEGTAELAAFINGYNPGGFDSVFIANPDMQLNDWPDDPANPSADVASYGAGFLFMDYFLNRFGEQATRTLVQEPANGLEGVTQVLDDLKAVDPLTGRPVGVDDLFLDWAVANYVQDPSVADGRYAYKNYPTAPKAGPTEAISICPQDPAARTVHQYGADYIRITCPGSYTLHFAGATSTPLLPANPHSGNYAFWSNKGDTSDMTLTHTFDFSGVSAPVSLTYWTWFDLENEWDYVYLEASTDGQHWDILTTQYGTASDPTGNSFGWGYTGSSDGWKQESLDLSRFAGRKVWLRFEYVTDLAVNGEGFLLDDFSIPAIGYSTGFETDDGGWQAAGFARVENVLPQTFRLALIEKGSSGTTVQIVPVNPDQTADVPLALGPNGASEAVLVVTGTTPFTRSLAQYQLSIR